MSLVIEILKDKFVGKFIHLCVSDQSVIQPYMVYKKKSNNVTDKQFDNGKNPKFRMEAHRVKVIGRNRKFENIKILDVEWVYEVDEYSDYYTINLVLENGSKVQLSPGIEKIIL